MTILTKRTKLPKLTKPSKNQVNAPHLPSRGGFQMVEVLIALSITFAIILPLFLYFSAQKKEVEITEEEFKGLNCLYETREQFLSLPDYALGSMSFTLKPGEESQVIPGKEFTLIWSPMARGFSRNIKVLKMENGELFLDCRILPPNPKKGTKELSDLFFLGNHP